MAVLMVAVLCFLDMIGFPNYIVDNCFVVVDTAWAAGAADQIDS